MCVSYAKILTTQLAGSAGLSKIALKSSFSQWAETMKSRIYQNSSHAQQNFQKSTEKTGAPVFVPYCKTTFLCWSFIEKIYSTRDYD